MISHFNRFVVIKKQLAILFYSYHVITECADGSYGSNCVGICSGNCLTPPCDKFTDNGACPDGRCVAGWDSHNCTQGLSI